MLFRPSQLISAPTDPDSGPANQRRLVLLLYAFVLPPFTLLLLLASDPSLRVPAVTAVLTLCIGAAAMLVVDRDPGPRSWIFPVGVAPTLSCGIAFLATHGYALGFMAVMGAPLAWAAVIFTGPAVVTAWVTGVVSCFVVTTVERGWMVGAGNAALYAIIQGLVAWVVNGQTLRRELSFLRALRLDLNDIELVLHPDGRILQANDRAAQAYQYSRDELLTMSIRDLRKADPDVARAQMARLTDHGALVFQAEHFRKDGSLLPVEVSARLVIVDGVTVVHSLVRDITERKRVLDALTLERERLTLATRAAGVGIWDMDFEATRLHWDDQMCRLYGIEPAQFLGTEADWLSRIHPDDRHRTIDEVYGVVASGSDYDSEFRIVRPDGEVRHMRSMARVWRTSSGQPTRIVGTNWDITAQVQAAGRFAALAEQAEAANRAKSEFLANMSHEIRTPLHAVLGLLELLLDSELGDEEKQFVQMAQASGRQLRDLLDDILDLTKIEAGRLALDSVDFDLVTLLDDLARGFAVSAAQKGLTLTVTTDADVPRVLRGDPRRLRQVLVNLVGNAVKFTERGSITVRATLTSRDDAHAQVRFSVTDTGIGIPHDKVSLLFGKFNQVSGSITRKYGGTGLGLAISKEFVALMGGTIGVSSDEGHGSEFWFTVRLPVAGSGVPD